MLDDRTHTIVRLLTLVWIGISVALIAVAFGGFADEWLQDNTLCGDGDRSYSECAPGEAQQILRIVGPISLAVGLMELAVMSVVVRPRRAARA